MPDSLLRLLQKLKEAVDAPEPGVSLPPEAYTTEDLFQLEREKIIRKGWINVGRADELKEPGSYLTADIDTTPVVVVRQEDMSIKAFANVCKHRSMIVASGSGKADSFSCIYHGWTYGLDGELISAPSMPRQSFCKEGHALTELRLELWVGFMFVNLDQNASPLADDLAELTAHLAEYDLENYQTFRHDQIYARCNWKVAVENGLETYHLTATHGETLAPLAPAKNVRMEPARARFQHYDHLLADDVVLPDEMPENFIPNDIISPERKRLTVVGGVYPCMVYVVGYDWAWWISCQPISVNEVRIDHGICARYDLKGESPDPTDPSYYFLDLDTEFVAEDIPRIEGVQRGAESGFAVQCELHPLEMPIQGFLSYLITELSNDYQPNLRRVVIG